jgi:hypothetical protein
MEKKYALFFALFLIGICTTISSCSIFNPPEVIPCYGHIDSIPLIITNASVQGTSANGINCAWVYVDDNPVGAFQLPCTFPVIATTGPHKVEIFAGISENGENETRLKYPFYTAYTSSGVTLTQGAVTKFKLSTNYASWTDIPLLEDFDNDLNPQFSTISSIAESDTSMFIIHKGTNSNVYQGIASGEVYLDGVKHTTYYGFSDTFDLANNGDAIFLELNYKSNSAFGIGINSAYISQFIPPFIYIDTANTWKKLYVNLQPAIQGANVPAENGEDGYRIYFYMQTATAGVPEILYLDNIKLVRYKQ